MTARPARAGSPAAVESFAEALAEWLSSFTVPQELAAEMAAACATGAPWAAALAGTSVRRAGWPEREALAWGIAIGALAGALEAARRSIAVGDGTGDRESHSGTTRAADGPALPLLAADGLIAAAHEALSSLDPDRLLNAMESLRGAFEDGGPWRHPSARWPRPSWPAVVACGLGPAAADDPGGPWADLAGAWQAAFTAPRLGEPAHLHADAEVALGGHRAADQDTNELFAEATAAAQERVEGSGDDARF